ncbi:helix-turn-helix transcriptional regulator [Adlercreutzia sp. ZJ138]|uniref:helix-turn-helix transcriptional regulator n=1 Tax=Adlercreutzia sp. ZJ138 TaxID=2709405 RepID=UPI0013EA716B|nr:helix-turn-helix transcriptional regulator [Adlercreutzia sp. ZJ138]
MEKLSGFVKRLVQVCPALPFMAFAMWQAWFFVLFSGSVWLSDTEVNGSNISSLFICSSGATGLIMLAIALLPTSLRDRFVDPPWVVGGAAVTAFGCFAIIAIGPYYLLPMLDYEVIRPLFYLSGVVSGIGMAPVLLRCGRLYAELPPRRVVFYVACSHLVAACAYFVIIGSPTWAPVAGGPSLCGILFFVLLPLAAGLLAVMPTNSFELAAGDEEHPRGADGQSVSFEALPKTFIKLVVVVFVFSVTLVSIHAVAVQSSPIGETLDRTRVVMLLHMVLATAFVCMAVGMNMEALNLGKAYSAIMVLAVMVVAVLPALNIPNAKVAQVAVLVSFLFEFLLWCIVSFVLYQKRYSPTMVFGWAYGAYLMGNSLGWALGAYELSRFAGAPNEFVIYIVLAVVVLAVAFFMYSEKDFEALFEPESEEESPIQELLAEELVTPQVVVVQEAPVRKRFAEVIDTLAQGFGLSARETDVFQCLAMGYDVSATAERLQVSKNTVRTHTRNVYAKLGVHSRQELIDLVDTEKHKDE